MSQRYQWNPYRQDQHREDRGGGGYISSPSEAQSSPLSQDDASIGTTLQTTHHRSGGQQPSSSAVADNDKQQGRVDPAPQQQNQHPLWYEHHHHSYHSAYAPMHHQGYFNQRPTSSSGYLEGQPDQLDPYVQQIGGGSSYHPPMAGGIPHNPAYGAMPPPQQLWRSDAPLDSRQLCHVAVPSPHAVPVAPPLAQLQDQAQQLGARWVSYIRSAEKDTVIEAMIDSQTTPTLQHLMLDAIFEEFLSTSSKASPISADGSDSPSYAGTASSARTGPTVGDGRQTFLSLCQRDRANILICLLKRWSAWRRSAAGPAALPSPTASRDYFQICADAIEYYWSHLVTHQLGSIALCGLFHVLPADPHQARLARLVLRDVTTAPATLALDTYGNFLLSELIKASSAQSARPQAALAFIPHALAQAWCDPAVFAQLAESNHGSHVLDHYFRHAPASAVISIWESLLNSTQPIPTDGNRRDKDDDVSMLVRLACDLRANYPLQTALKALRRSTRSPHVQPCASDPAAHGCNCLCCQATAPRLDQLFLVAQSTFREQLEDHLSATAQPSSRTAGTPGSPESSRTVSKALQYSKNVLKILQQ